MERIENWETVEAKGMEDFKTLPIFSENYLKFYYMHEK